MNFTFNVDVNTLMLMITSLATLGTALITMYFTRRTEKNTNSMKDALIASTAKASRAEGKEEGQVEGEQKAADLVLATEAAKPKEVKIVNLSTEPVPVVSDNQIDPLPVTVVNPKPVPVTVKKE